MHRGVQVADRPQALAGVVDREFGGEPLPQQSAAAALDVTLRSGLPLGLVEPGERDARQFCDGLLVGGRGVGEPAVALRSPEIGTEDRIEGGELVDVRVGDLAGQRLLRL